MKIHVFAAQIPFLLPDWARAGRVLGFAAALTIALPPAWALAQASPVGGGPGSVAPGINSAIPSGPVTNGTHTNPTQGPENVPLQDPNRPLPLTLPPAAPNVGGAIQTPSPAAGLSPRSGPIGPSILPDANVPNYSPPPVPTAGSPASPPPSNLEDGIPANTFGHLGVTVIPNDEGDALTVTGIERTSPAFPAGLLIDDQITSINGQRLTKFADLIKGLRAAAQSDGNVNLLVRRRGTLDTINVMVGGKKAQVDRPQLGVTLDDSNGRLRVTGVTPKSPAAGAGLQAGDEIVTVNDYPVSTYDLFVGQIQAMGRAGGQIPLGIRRKGTMMALHATIGDGKAPALPKSELPPADGPSDIK